jgi:hypothetical protein
MFEVLFTIGFIVACFTVPWVVLSLIAAVILLFMGLSLIVGLSEMLKDWRLK